MYHIDNPRADATPIMIGAGHHQVPLYGPPITILLIRTLNYRVHALHYGINSYLIFDRSTLRGHDRAFDLLAFYDDSRPYDYHEWRILPRQFVQPSTGIYGTTVPCLDFAIRSSPFCV